MKEARQEQSPTERSLEIGDWFNPFTNYHVTPYNYKDEDSSTKSFSFIANQIGKFFIGMYWDRESRWWEESRLSPSTGMITSFLGDETINRKDYLKVEKKNETRLLKINVEYLPDEYEGQDSPYQVEIRSLNGKVFASPFHRGVGGRPMLTGLFHWHEDHREEVWLLIPEVENILERIQMRIVPKD